MFNISTKDKYIEKNKTKGTSRVTIGYLQVYTGTYRLVVSRCGAMRLIYTQHTGVSECACFRTNVFFFHANIHKKDCEFLCSHDILVASAHATIAKEA